MTISKPPPRLRTALVRLMVALVLVAAGVGVVWGYMAGQTERAIDAEEDTPVAPPLRVSMVAGEPTITLDEAALQSGGIHTVALQDVADDAKIHAYGLVLDLQPLTDLSNSYANTYAQLQTAEAKLDASRMAFERAQRLFQDQQNISAAQMQSAEAAFRVDQASVAAAQTQLQNLASSASQQWGAVLGRALVDRAPIFLRLLQREDVLLQVTLPPGESMVEPPRTAVAQSSGASPAKIAYVSPAPRTDSRIQGISYFYVVPANSGFLPGMNLDVTLSSGKSAAGAFVPASAVVWSDGKAWAYFKTGARTFARRAIVTDTPAPDGGYIVSGLPAGSEVVGSGAQMLLSEEFRAQIHIED